MMFTPSGDVCEEAAVCVGSVNAKVTADLLVEYCIDVSGRLLDLSSSP
jgi:hypothetical protein